MQTLALPVLFEVNITKKKGRETTGTEYKNQMMFFKELFSEKWLNNVMDWTRNHVKSAKTLRQKEFEKKPWLSQVIRIANEIRLFAKHDKKN